MPVTFYRLTKTIIKFISFLCSDIGQNIMSLSIHVESRHIFYNDFNTKENFDNFLLAQQDKSKQFIPKRISYHYNFEKYIRSYLPSFSIKKIDKFHMLSNKNLKYPLYKFNDCIEAMDAEKILIRHASKAKDEVGLPKIEEKNKQFLIEKIVSEIERKI